MGKSYNMLSSEDIETIHEASLTVLQNIGLRLSHPVAWEKLSAAGASVDKSKERVLLPPEMVADALARAPGEFTCAGRSSEFDFTVQSGYDTPPKVRTGGGAINHFDLIGNTSRPLTLADCRDIARMADALENINSVGCPAPQDAPKSTYDLHTLKALLESGRKHVWALTASSENLKLQLEMMLAVAGGSRNLRERPICSGIVCLIEPLYFPDDEIERLLLYGQYNLPVKVPLVPMSGANAPYTLAGVLTHTNAEALGSLVLLQTLCPGIPSWLYFLPQDMEMTRGSAKFFSPELMLISSGLIQLARHYGLPSALSPYICTSSQAIQMMFERSAALVMQLLSGVTEMGGAGIVDGGMAMSPLALVIDNELAAFNNRLGKGFAINAGTLAVDAIERVGHHGNYVEDPHTLEFLRREERFHPSLLDWRTAPEGPDGQTTILERAECRMREILDQHRVPPLDPQLKRELARIIQADEARRRAA